MATKDKRKPGIDELREEFLLALALEEEAAARYRSLAADCDDPEAARWLMELSRQETRHAVLARRLVRLAENVIARRSRKKSKN